MAQVHRFYEKVALHVSSGETEYITPYQARALAQALIAYAGDVDRVPYLDSKIGTTHVSLHNSDLSIAG